MAERCGAEKWREYNSLAGPLSSPLFCPSIFLPGSLNLPNPLGHTADEPADASTRRCAQHSHRPSWQKDYEGRKMGVRWPKPRGLRPSVSRRAINSPHLLQQPREDVFVREISGPAVGGEHGLVEAAVSVVQLRRALVVEVCQRPPLQFLLALLVFRHRPRITGRADAAGVRVVDVLGPGTVGWPFRPSATESPPTTTRRFETVHHPAYRCHALNSIPNKSWRGRTDIAS